MYPTIALGAVLALGACSGAAEPDASPAAQESTTAADPTTDSDTAEPAEPTETETAGEEPAPDTETGDDAPVTGGDASCVEGTWLYPAAEFEKTFVEMMGQGGGAGMGDISVTGDSTMTFDGSTLTQAYGPQEVKIDVDSSGMDMTMTMKMAGKTTAAYTVDGDVITVTDVDTSDYSVSSQVLVDGEEMPGLEDLGLDELMGEVGTAEGTVQFGCSGDTLTLTAIVPEMPDFSFSYNLTRQ